MGWNGVGKLIEVEGRMDATQYVDILNHHLLCSVQKSRVSDKDNIFKQESNPKHTTRKATK